MRKAEVDGLLRAAQACGVTGDDLATVEAAAKSGAKLGTVDTSSMTDWQRAVTYAIASWLARLDGVVNADEMAHLKELGAALGLPQAKLDSAASAAFDIACLPGGHRPDKFDFDALATRLKEKLPSLV